MLINPVLKSYEISLLVNRGQRAFNTLLRTCLSHNNLTVPQWAVLGQLYAHEVMRPTEIASLLGIKPPFTTILIKLLREADLIEIIIYKDDERGKQIRLTDNGRLKVETVEKKLQTCISQQLGELEQTKLSTYYDVCEYMATNVRHHDS